MKYIDGPVGVRARNFVIHKICKTGWTPKFKLINGLRLTYPWIEEQVKNRRSTAVVGEFR